MNTREVFLRSVQIRDELKSQSDYVDNPINTSLLPVLAYRTFNKVRLIIIGQDPTVKRADSRACIEYALNLDKPGSLRLYVGNIVKQLGFSWENIYATNVFKYFYSIPPQRTMHVLHRHLKLNLNLLNEEISTFPNVPIIVLGLPLLQLLADETSQVREFWDYDPKTRKSLGEFAYCKASDNKLGRNFFPFPHQPSLAKTFYRDAMNGYLRFMKRTIGS